MEIIAKRYLRIHFSLSLFPLFLFLFPFFVIVREYIVRYIAKNSDSSGSKFELVNTRRRRHSRVLRKVRLRDVVRAYLFLSHDGTFVTFCRRDDDGGLGRVVTSNPFLPRQSSTTLAANPLFIND